jgi:hypothetical protein
MVRGSPSSIEASELSGDFVEVRGELLPVARGGATLRKIIANAYKFAIIRQ